MTTTVSDARALPELPKANARYDGAVAKELCTRRPDGSVCLFIDTDGQIKKVVRTGRTESKILFQPEGDWGR